MLDPHNYWGCGCFSPTITPEEPGNAVFGFLKKAKGAILTGAEAVGKAGSALATMAEDVFRDKNAVKRQMLFYGVVNLYRDGLEKFMNM